MGWNSVRLSCVAKCAMPQPTPSSAEQPDQHDSLDVVHVSTNSRSWAGRIFALSFTPLFLLYLTFAVPFLGMFPYLGVYTVISADCPKGGSGGMPKECLRNGVDIAGLSVTYGITGVFLGGIANPVLALSVVRALVPLRVLVPWLAIIVVSFVAWRVAKRRVRISQPRVHAPSPLGSNR
jgi:hypothetical protein